MLNSYKHVAIMLYGTHHLQTQNTNYISTANKANCAFHDATYGNHTLRYMLLEWRHKRRLVTPAHQLFVLIKTHDEITIKYPNYWVYVIGIDQCILCTQAHGVSMYWRRHVQQYKAQFVMLNI